MALPSSTLNARLWDPDGNRIAAFVGASTSDFRSLIPARQLRHMAPDLDAAFSRVKAGHGDTIYILPDYTESVSSADQFSSLVAGTRVVGMGYGQLRPTFTWTATAASFLLDVANVELHNLIMKFASSDNGGVTVTAPMTISAAGCGLYDNQIFFGDDADDIVTRGIVTTAAADDLTLKRNHCIGATAAECTTFMDIIGCDRLHMEDNVFEGATSAVGVGIVRFATTASLNIRLNRNTYINRKALSTCAVTGLAGVSGVSRNEHFAYLDALSLTPWLTSTGLMTFHRPTVTNTAGETGTEAVGTVSA